MKNTKINDVKQFGFLASIAQGIANKFEQIPVDPNGCWAFLIYEPELSDEVINELSSHQ